MSNIVVGINAEKALIPPYGSPLGVNNPSKYSQLIGELSSTHQVAESTTIAATLAALSTSLQGLIDIELPTGKVVPSSLITLVISASGERKSTIERAAMQPIRNFQTKERHNTEEPIRQWKEDYKIWNLIKTKLSNKIAHLKAEGEDDKDYSSRLKIHLTTEPVRPQCIRLLYEKATPEALLDGLDKNYPFASLVSSEGGIALNSQFIASLAAINTLWSGDTVTADTKTAGSIHLEEARLGVFIMVQDGVFQQYIKKSKGLARDSGFMARALFCNAPSLAGQRTHNNSKLSSRNTDIYTEKLGYFLELLKTRKRDEPKTIIKFSAVAQKFWFEIANQIETLMGFGNRFYKAQDHASKLAELICRVAGIIHCYESNTDEEVSIEILQTSLNICLHFSDQFLKAFDAPPEYIYNAEILSTYLDQYYQKGRRFIRKNHLMQRGPRAIRTKVKLDDALGYLYDTNKIGYLDYKNTCVIDLYPGHMFNPQKIEIDIGSFNF